MVKPPRWEKQHQDPGQDGRISAGVCRARGSNCKRIVLGEMTVKDPGAQLPVSLFPGGFNAKFQESFRRFASLQRGLELVGRCERIAGPGETLSQQEWRY